jgi:HK97 gp10 family phage protein
MARIKSPSNLKTIRFDLKGVDELLKKIEQAGNNVERVVMHALEESAKPIYQDLDIWTAEHALTGATRKGMNLSDVVQEGNQFYVDVGIDTSKGPLAWHAVFVEYGSPTQKADPGIRRAFEDNKARVKKIQKKILEEGGIPTG